MNIKKTRTADDNVYLVLFLPSFELAPFQAKKKKKTRTRSIHDEMVQVDSAEEHPGMMNEGNGEQEVARQARRCARIHSV